MTSPSLTLPGRVVLITLLLAPQSALPAGETLDNGIVLPEIWPPQDLDPTSDEPMPVPYLDHPPRVIPIDSGRQLFVDDFLIEKSTLKRRFHTATKFEGNPVLQAKTPDELAASTRGESATVYLGQGGVFFDPAEQHFKMFYTAGWRGGLGLATSVDLVHWQRPELGLAGGNLLLPPGIRWNGPKLTSGGSDNCVWLDLNAANPIERIKFLTCWQHAPRDQRPDGFNHSLHVSDGHNWSDGVPTGMASDYCNFFYNPFRNKWVFSLKQNGPRGRSRAYSENAEFLAGADWSKSAYWCCADRLDKPDAQIGDPAQLYSLRAVAYESILLGEFQIHLGPVNKICHAGKFPKITELKLGFSRDGFHWSRPDRRPFIAATRRAGDWDRGYIHGTTGVCVVRDDQLWFPYCGFSGIAPDGTRGMYTGGSVGMATLRRDGFASMEADAAGGTLTTRVVTFSGQHLFVNLNTPNGELLVELLDEAENVVATSQRISSDSTKQRVEWSDRASLDGNEGIPMRFRFHLTNGQLFAFWVSADANGASNGYVGAGGPGFSGVRDTAPTLR